VAGQRVLVLLVLQLLVFGLAAVSVPAAAALVSSSDTLTAAAGGGQVASSANIQNLTLTLITTASTNTFLARAADQYTLQRAGEVIIHVRRVPSLGLVNAGERAFAALKAGEGDAAFIAVTPTAAQLVEYPDLLSFPLWASAYAPVFNVPEIGALRMPLGVLAQIYAGLITHWNDPLLVAANGGESLPNQPIHVVLQDEPNSYIRDFTIAMTQAEPILFDIPVADEPAWPTERYARFTRVRTLEGPTSFVLTTPYTLSVALVGLASKLRVSIASVINPSGASVEPSFSSIQLAMAERGIASQRNNATGAVEFRWTGNLALAPGSRSWPLTMAASLLLPRTYTRQGCRARSELAKFIRWMLNVESIRYALAIAERTTLLPDSMDKQLGVSDALMHSLRCGVRAVVNSGEVVPITLAGSEMSALSQSMDMRDLFLQTYASVDDDSHYVSSYADERESLEAILNPQAEQSIDIVWILPVSFERMYPGVLEGYYQTNELTLVHMGLYGVTVAFNLPTAVMADYETHLPLVLDVDTIAHLFLGNIASWRDARLATLNPLLGASFTSTGADDAITLVFAGRGVLNTSHQFGVSNHFVMTLNASVPFQQDTSLTWEVPADWTQIAARLTARGIRFRWVESEYELEAAVARIPGAIGYYLAQRNTSDPRREFRVQVQAVVDPSRPDVLSPFVLAPSPETFLACAAGTEPSERADFIAEAAVSTALKYANCWPFPMLMSLALPKSVGFDANSRVTKEALCFRQSRVTRFAQWLSTQSSMINVAAMLGRGTIAALPNWRTFNLQLLDEITCAGEPILWTPALVWNLSDAVAQFSVAVSIICGVLTLAIILAVVHYRHRTILRIASLGMQALMFLGVLLLVPTPALLAADATTETCSSFS